MGSQFAASSPVWAGPTFESFVDAWGIGKQKCQIVSAMVGHTILVAMAQGNMFAENGTAVRAWVRPLLPHERSCADTAIGNLERLIPTP